MNNTSYDKTIIIITGPTAAGKTDFALELGSQISSEIVNMDMGQMYEPLSIGTAKPHWKSLPIPHHMFDVINTPSNYTVVEYRKAFISTCRSILERKKIPIVVGGSLFYLKSLFFPPDHNVAQCEKNTSLQHVDKDRGMLWEELFSVDPARAEKIDKSDRYRIERALDIWYTTGKKPSTCILSYSEPIKASYIILYVTRDRAELYQRIDQRVISMIDEGWIDEIHNLIETPWQLFIQNKKIIGYNELITFLTSSNKSYDEYEKVINVIQRKSRNYAKRQDTFWRGLRRNIEAGVVNQEVPFMQEVNLSQCNQSEYIPTILKRLLKDIGNE